MENKYLPFISHLNYSLSMDYSQQHIKYLFIRSAVYDGDQRLLLLYSLYTL